MSESNGRGNGHGPVRGGLAREPVRFGIDPELTDWLLLYQGPTIVIGKATGGAEAIRTEMEEGTVPTATLTPAYCLVSHIMMTDRGMGQVQPMLIQLPFRLEQFTNIGRTAKLPLQVTLTAFGFLAGLDAASKAHVVKTLVDYEQGLQASQAGIVMPPGAGR